MRERMKKRLAEEPIYHQYADDEDFSWRNHFCDELQKKPPHAVTHIEQISFAQKAKRRITIIEG